MNSEELKSAWKSVCDQVSSYNAIDASQMNAFFSRLQPQAMSDGFLMLTADNDFIKTWIEKHYASYIKQALREIYGIDSRNSPLRKKRQSNRHLFPSSHMKSPLISKRSKTASFRLLPHSRLKTSSSASLTTWLIPWPSPSPRNPGARCSIPSLFMVSPD